MTCKGLLSIFSQNGHFSTLSCCSTKIFLKQLSEENNGLITDIVVEDETKEKKFEDDKFILCAQCLNLIAKESDQIVIGGAHRHTFANPHGILFEIVCFSFADGCRYVGPSTDEFTWFKGYVWRIAVCGKCLVHLGWHYISPGKDSFYGLIIDRLIYPK
jgi:hypothetical protein